jgi:hypothetical protein
MRSCSLASIASCLAIAAGTAGCNPDIQSNHRPGPDGGGGFAGDAGFTFAVSDGGDTGPPAACAGQVETAKPVPLDVFFLVDSSGSMTDRFGAQSKWQMVRSALTSFLSDGRSAGLGAGLQFFPIFRSCTGDADCRGSAGSAPTCSPRRKCVVANLSVEDANDCRSNADCLGTGQCTPIGSCSRSGALCSNIGQPCTGGTAETCTALSRLCDGALGVEPAACTSAPYETPAVPMAVLPANVAPIATALARTIPKGGTPLLGPMQGALKVLGEHLARNPTHVGALVLATDGSPMGCADTLADLTNAAAAAHRASPPISTYAIGVFEPTDPEGPAVLGPIATAGGTGTPFVLRPDADLGRTLLEALDQIRGRALPCAFTIPPPSMGTLDFARVNFSVDTGAGPQDLYYVRDASRCPASGGWYYDVDPARGVPTQVLVCESTCGAIKSAANARVDIRYGCERKEIP